ncbi:Gamma-glutamyltransferase [Heterostelium album PN500]|uniref:Gamma-glutamyltransferase n=1 Tax=Heterostelium pallidum (strain ATCC 26659 / Pp 5 / PN500) TaxID=670386 RepID=D3B9K4_HETP5|nr:Gamma-glutamyltransferase [Heterostelium album PN500]EFA81916.1 Gamma-glutamyltransferase [Heterostelium album PN500]|eukprot:XP_020434033.1 Gamma-glutamyltransferase [Heterostelium album PN500]
MLFYKKYCNSTPEVTSGWYKKEKYTSKEFMVVSAHPLATKAGYDIINIGGNAIDSMIAVQLVLNLVEPQSSGIGGGSYLIYFDKKNDKLLSFDGRETAPSGVTEKLFFNQTTNQPKTFIEALVGGSSVGVPGTLKLMEHVHSQFGKLPWKQLFQPAIKLCIDGFPIGNRLATMLAMEKYKPFLLKDPESRKFFYNSDLTPKKEGQILKNVKLAKVFQRISLLGSDAGFYNGEIASKIVAKVKNHPTNPGFLEMEDLRKYQIKSTTPICHDYQKNTVCTTRPSGIILLQILGILDSLPNKYRIENLPPTLENIDNFGKYYQPTTKALHIFSEASKLAFADRNRYLADLDLNWDLFLEKKYLKERSALITEKSLGQAVAGKFTREQLLGNSFKEGHSHEFPCTSHISIVDKEGNSVSMTTSIENGFGSTLMVEGFLLNNQLTDFSFDPYDVKDQCSVANKVSPNKRPRSSMSPTLVFKKHEDTSNRGKRSLLMSIGSAGGPTIPLTIAKSIVASMNWGITLQDSFNMLNFGSINQNAQILIELGRINKTNIDILKNQYGHENINYLELSTGLQGIMYDDKEKCWVGASDPRKEGIAMVGCC